MGSELPADWDEARLGDCGRWLSGGTPSTKNPDFWDGDIPWISGKSLTTHYLRDSDRRVTTLGAANGTRIAPQGSTLMVVRGMSLQTEFRSGIAMRELAFGQDCKAIIPREGVEPRFLANAVRARAPEILGMVDSSSHGTGRLATELIQGLRIGLPPMEEQRAIAEVLGALDDRIEWCARLRMSCVELLTTAFAGAALQRVAVGELADVVAGQSPPGSTYNTDGEGLPFFQGSAQFGALVPTAEKWCSAPQRVAEPGDLLFSVRAPVGDLNVTTEKVCIGRGLAAIRSPFRAATYAALTLSASAWSVHDGSGTVFGSINGRDLRATRVPWPDDVEALAPTLEALMDRALAAEVESRGFARTRDALLPRLLSGELRIVDPARVLGAVA